MRLMHLGPIASIISCVSSRGLSVTSKRDACSGNTASDRASWCDYSLSTDYYNEVPETGVVREYWLNLLESTVSPDGVERPAMTVNGSIPGPTIIADWGDTVVVHVTNSFSSSSGNGTSIHFHGIRQNYTNSQDGVVSITQCPLTPGSSMTYTWRATQYGTTWYHSHFALQAWEGVFGGIIINGPASSNYDEDKGVIFLNDWSHQTIDELWYSAEIKGAQTFDTGLINGTNVWGDDGASNQTGSRFSTQVNSGSSYRLRLVNAAADTLWRFSIDNHTLTVIANDLVPIQPYSTELLAIAIGQRYDIIVEANQASVASDFWIRATPQSPCSDNDSADNIKGIWYYGDSPSTPTTTGYNYTQNCSDELSSNLVPYLSKTVSDPTYTEDKDISLGYDSTGTYFRWFIQNETFQVDWGNPTLLQVLDNTTDFSASSNVAEIDDADQWVYLIIQNETPVAHPVHLHGHDFFVLAQSASAFSSDSALNLDNPTRRDVAVLPVSPGYLVLAFQTDNPGTWLAHCHISFHQSEGFAFQFVEQRSKIPSLVDSDELSSRCDAWNSYATSYSVTDNDSGI